VEEGSAWSTVAGIDSNVETWWRNKFTASGSFATQGLDDMRTTFNNCTKGSMHPDLLVTTQTVYQYYEKILQPLERFLDQKAADAGFQNLLFKGSPIMWDEYCTAGYMYFLNSEFIHWIVDSETDFTTTPFMRPNNQDAEVAQILTYANLALSNRARQGVMTAIVA
jgi:hypothetical protein